MKEIVHINISEYINNFIHSTDLHLTESFEKHIQVYRTLHAAGYQPRFLFLWVNELFNNLDRFNNVFLPQFNNCLSEHLDANITILDCIFNNTVNVERITNLNNSQIYKVEWFEYVLYLLHKYSLIDHVDKWDSTKHKPLCLFGKMEKTHRIFLAQSLLYYEMFDEDIMDWAFVLPDERTSYNDAIKLSLAQYSDMPLSSLNSLRRYQKNLDLTLSNAATDNFFHSCGFYYDKTLFENTLFSIISETEWDFRQSDFATEESVFLTEKTYKCFLTRHPFLLIAQYGAHEYLKKRGYKTYSHLNKFQNFIDGKPYKHSLNDVKNFFNNIPCSIKEFTTSLKINHEDVNKIVEHNYCTFFDNGRKTEKILHSFNKVTQNGYLYDDFEHFLFTQQYSYKMPDAKQFDFSFLESREL